MTKLTFDSVPSNNHELYIISIGEIFKTLTNIESRAMLFSLPSEHESPQFVPDMLCAISSVISSPT